MSLKSCPDCGGQVSSYAITCPHCGRYNLPQCFECRYFSSSYDDYSCSLNVKRSPRPNMPACDKYVRDDD